MPELNLGTLTITSPAFEHGGDIPARHAADNENEPPPLRWSGVPEGTAELVLIVHDPDAPLTDGFTHWVVHGIDPTTEAVEGGDFGEDEVVVGANELGDTEYMGPAPPPGHGKHHYFFHLYALSEPIEVDRPLTRAELLEAMEGRILEQARLVGRYER